MKQLNEKKKNKEITILLKQQEIIEADEYAHKVSELQKFVLKSNQSIPQNNNMLLNLDFCCANFIEEMLFFISQNGFQKKPEVSNMALSRDEINKDLLKAYTSQY